MGKDATNAPERRGTQVRESMTVNARAKPKETPNETARLRDARDEGAKDLFRI
jgi:hypothetical protein